jgi:outer membrane protein TolC
MVKHLFHRSPINRVSAAWQGAEIVSVTRRLAARFWTMVTTCFALTSLASNTSVFGQSAYAFQDETSNQLRPAIPTGDDTDQPAAVSATPSRAANGQLAATNAANSRKSNAYIPDLAPTEASAGVLEPKLKTRGDQESVSGPAAALGGTAEKEKISLQPPTLKALVSVNDYLSPFSLDANASQSTTLRQVLTSAIDRNLDLAVSRSNTKIKQWNYASALGRFLPELTMSFQENFLKGAVGLPFNQGFGANVGSATTLIGNRNVIHLDSPFILMGPGFRFYGYRGGRVLFGSLEAKHNYKAAQAEQHGTLSDTLMTVTRNYYNLVLSEAVLQIRIQAVRTSEEQLRNNTNRFHSGLATALDVMQSRTQLSRDRQNLVDQQITRRNAAIDLAQSINANLGADLLPADMAVRKIRLVDPKLNVGDLLRFTIDNRPELKQYEELRLAAKRAIIVAGAPLQPTFALSGNILGVGPPRTLEALYILGLNVNWSLGGMGTVDYANLQAARWQARQAHLQANKELVAVLAQTRQSLLRSLDTDRNIEETSNEVASSAEQLRLAQLRFASGLGTNIDIITAQRDYTQALVSKAEAMINFNIAQAQLLHDMGVISVDALTSGRLLSK